VEQVRVMAAGLLTNWASLHCIDAMQAIKGKNEQELSFC
jgi:hypothetical protein